MSSLAGTTVSGARINLVPDVRLSQRDDSRERAGNQRRRKNSRGYPGSCQICWELAP